MLRFAPTPFRDRSTLRRAAAACALVTLAALVAVGCGDDGGGSGAGESGIVGGEGPLAWLPADTWVVASADLGADRLDTAIATLDRLPAWSLAESFLPASDGKGLRREAFEAIARSAKERDVAITAKELEAVFGDRVGMAMTSSDLAALTADDVDDAEVPIAAWIEVDDEEAALELMQDSTKGEDTESEHEGHDVWYSKSDDFAYTAADGLLLIATSDGALERLIDVREGDGDSLADDAEARAVIEAGIGEAIFGIAVQSGPLLDAAPELVRAAAEDAEGAEARRLEQVADELGPVLESDAIDGLVADWSSMSFTIDETGLRSRGAWSNPRELADPEVGSRELVERMPEDATVVTGMVQDGSTLARVQAAWAEVRDAYDVELRDLAGECAAADRWACDLGVELAATLLEDESLAEASEQTGETSAAFVQDVGAMFAAMTAGGRSTGRWYEIAMTGTEDVDWTPPAPLLAAATRAGLVVVPGAGGSLTIRIRAGSPLARRLATLPADSRTALAAIGIDLRRLQSPAGLEIAMDEIDGIRVSGLPQDSPSKVVPALEGDAEVLGDSDTYAEVVEAAGVPDELGVYGYVDLRAYAEAIITAIAAAQPEAQRALPTVRNNLADAPGVVWWTSRDEVEDERVGTYEAVMPILE